MAPANRGPQRKSLSQRLGVAPATLDAVVSPARAHNLMAYLYDTFPSAYWDSDELTTLALGICMLARDAQTVENMAELGEDQPGEALPMLGALADHHQSIRDLWAPMLEIDCSRDRRGNLTTLIQERLNGYDTSETVLDTGMALVRRPERRARLTFAA
jgi:hypothetical protein